MTSMRVRAKDLKVGDVTVSTKETVKSVSFKHMGTEYERKQVFLTLGHNGLKRDTWWNKNTLIQIERPE